MSEERGLLEKSDQYQDCDDEDDFQQHKYFSKRPIFSLCHLCCAVCVSTLLLLLGITIGSFLQVSTTPTSDITTRPTRTTTPCKQLSVRREWRSLSQDEKHSYLDSVRCLHQRPSRLGLNQSLFHDFAWVHYGVCVMFTSIYQTFSLRLVFMNLPHSSCSRAVFIVASSFPFHFSSHHARRMPLYGRIDVGEI